MSGGRDRAVCQSGTEFIFVDELATFEVARQGCIERNSTLARISNQNEFDIVAELLATETIDSRSIWFGNLFFDKILLRKCLLRT